MTATQNTLPHQALVSNNAGNCGWEACPTKWRHASNAFCISKGWVYRSTLSRTSIITVESSAFGSIEVEYVNAWGQKSYICTSCMKYCITCTYKWVFSSKIRWLWNCKIWKQLSDLSCLYWTYRWYSLGSVKIPRRIYCPMHPALSSILLLLKSIFWNTKMPAEMQMRKRGKTIKTRSIVPSNVSKRTRVTGCSLADDIHNCQAVKPSLTFRYSTGHVRNQQVAMKSELGRRFPLQLLQPPEGDDYLKKKKKTVDLPKTTLVFESVFSDWEVKTEGHVLSTPCFLKE